MTDDVSTRRFDAFEEIAKNKQFVFKNSDALRLISSLLSTHALATQVFLYARNVAEGKATPGDVKMVADQIADNESRLDVLIKSLANMAGPKSDE